MCDIKFGTDGWRAIMCDDFIFNNVKKVAQAICNYLKAVNLAQKGIVIGYDTRFFSDRFAELAAGVCAANNTFVWLAEKDVPTPAVAFSIGRLKTAGAIMFTASHNPPEYNGLKFIPENMSPAMPEVTQKIEAEIKRIMPHEIQSMSFKAAKENNLVKTFDPKEGYVEKIKSLINADLIFKAKLEVVYDPLFGTGRDYVPAILGDICNTTTIHNYKDPYFGGLSPEPNQKNLTELIDRVKGSAHIGLATDGDADRFGVIDLDGTYISPNEVISIILMHFIKNKGLKGSVARTVATTHLIDKIASAHGIDVIETPVGFKYIGKALREDGAILGGEESGGLSITGHIPEKDGPLALSLMAEVRAYEGKSFVKILDEIMKKYGYCFTERIDLKVLPEKKKNLNKKLNQLFIKEFARRKVVKINELDGYKMILEDASWVLLRPSGTEPIVRIYIEAPSQERLAALKESALKIWEEIPVGG